VQLNKEKETVIFTIPSDWVAENNTIDAIVVRQMTNVAGMPIGAFRILERRHPAYREAFKILRTRAKKQKMPITVVSRERAVVFFEGVERHIRVVEILDKGDLH
jgi:hypothetical protein